MGCPLIHALCVHVSQSYLLLIKTAVQISQKSRNITKAPASFCLTLHQRSQSTTLAIRDGNPVSWGELGSLDSKPCFSKVLQGCPRNEGKLLGQVLESGSSDFTV